MLRRIKSTVEQIEATDSLDKLPNLTKLSGTSGFYRVKVGDYRIGLAIENDEVEFVRCLHRCDIYKYFP